MQFGIFSVSDITRNPITGTTPSEAERIDDIVRIARRADEVGLDVVAIGEHQNRPLFSSLPTTILARIAARTQRIIVSTSTTLITTNDPVRIAEEYAMLQHVCQGAHGPDTGRGNTVPVYPWFGQDIHNGVPWRWKTTICCTGCGAKTWWIGKASSPARCRASPRSRGRSTTCRPSSGMGRSARPKLPNRPPITAMAFSPTDVLAPNFHFVPLVNFYRERFAHYGHGTRNRRSSALADMLSLRKIRRMIRPLSPLFRGQSRLWQQLWAGSVCQGHAAQRRQPAAGHRQDPGLPGSVWRLPASALGGGRNGLAHRDGA